ncbi:MAG: VWA domain-containing protein [Ardenticatenales bacterium]|nr:VWA domain-containing protein [Ardenticatenales bacterium]
MGDADTLLLPLFEHLRRHGVPLGVSEYLLAVKSIREGIGVEDLDSLRRFCRLLWAKSREDQALFDWGFDNLVAPPSLPERTAGKGGKGEETPSEETSQETPSGEWVRPVTFRQVPLGGRNAPVLPDRSQPPPGGYQLTPRLPIDRREMAGAWRQLRRLQREGVPEELDVEQTIDTVCRMGFLLEPVLQPRRRNQARLLLLVDQRGSMAPFAMLISAFIESILRGGLLGKTTVYYFHDCPDEELYQRSTLTGAQPLTQVLVEHAQGSSVLIVSDAGAARGDYDGERVAATRAFLQALRGHTYLYAWLNPMPARRWTATTAEAIARLVPMSPLEREGLHDAISILRGHPFPPEVHLDG